MFNANKLTPEVVKSGLVLWLDGHDFDNSLAPATIRDRSGVGNTGTCSNFGNTATSGNTASEGIMFDGSNDVINCGHSTGFDVNYVTIEAILKVTIEQPLTAHFINKENTTGSESFMVALTATRQLILYIAGTARVYSTTNVPLNEFIHIAVKNDGTNASVYYNGALIVATASTATCTTTTYDVRIGNNSAASRQFNGQMKMVRIYNRALTAAEILQNYSASKNNS
jgi:hypothetical protein